MSGMKRKIMEKLIAWSVSPNRKPLVVLGARQVGKTFALKQFAAKHFDALAYIDFSRDADAAALFQGSLAPRDLVPALELYLRMTIDPERTLIVFDESQLCERSLTALKYFYEDAPQYHIIAAGSLLGVQISRATDSFPVGKVDLLHMHPLDFEEYLWAVGEVRLSAAIREACDAGNVAFPLHERALAHVRDYQLIGGMPEAVSAFVSAGANGIEALERARERQDAILVGYQADVIKYADKADATKIISAFASVPVQLAKENHKFQYKEIRSGARASQYVDAIDWLEAAGIALRCTRTEEGQAPLATFEERDAFKLYMADTGLLSARYEALPQDIEPAANKAAAFRGGLAENYVYQQICSQNAKAYCWGTVSRYEVEFVARTKAGDVIPIEVKSGKNVASTSLGVYRKKYAPAYSVRVSARNFGFEGGIKNVPLYAAWCLAEELL